LFGHFIREGATVKIPGAAFFCGSLLMLSAMLLALRAFNKSAPPTPVAAS
jgi:hypothetical protein